MFHALIRAGSVAACISAGLPGQIHTRHRRLCAGGIADGIGFDPTPASAAEFAGNMKKEVGKRLLSARHMKLGEGIDFPIAALPDVPVGRPAAERTWVRVHDMADFGLRVAATDFVHPDVRK